MAGIVAQLIKTIVLVRIPVANGRNSIGLSGKDLLSSVISNDKRCCEVQSPGETIGTLGSQFASLFIASLLPGSGLCASEHVWWGVGNPRLRASSAIAAKTRDVHSYRFLQVHVRKNFCHVLTLN